MYKKPQDKYISVDTDEFSFYLPVTDINRVELYKDQEQGRLLVYCKEQLFRTTERDYNALAELYLQISTYIRITGFIDLTCPVLTVCIRENDISGLTYDLSDINHQQIKLYYNNGRNYILMREAGGADVKDYYLDLLSQLTYAPFYTSNKLKSNHEKPDKLENDWCLIDNPNSMFTPK